MTDRLQKETYYDNPKAEFGIEDCRWHKAIEEIRRSKRKKLLDVGGGYKSVKDDLGVDWEVEVFDLTRDADYTGDINEDWPVSEKYDVVFCGEVIEHAKDTNHFLSQCMNALKDGGVLVITTPNLASWKNRLRLLFGRQPCYADIMLHYHVYTLSYLTKLVCDAGFRVIRLRGSGMIFTAPGSWNPFLRRIGRVSGDLCPALSHHIILTAQKYLEKNKK